MTLPNTFLNSVTKRQLESEHIMEYISKKDLIEKLEYTICDIFSYVDDYPEYTESGFSEELINEIINSLPTITLPDD